MAADRAAVTKVFRFDSFSGNASTIPLDSVSNMQNYENRHSYRKLNAKVLKFSLKNLLAPSVRTASGRFH